MRPIKIVFELIAGITIGLILGMITAGILQKIAISVELWRSGMI